jgi:hypothetical protein
MSEAAVIGIGKTGISPTALRRLEQRVDWCCDPAALAQSAVGGAVQRP